MQISFAIKGLDQVKKNLDPQIYSSALVGSVNDLSKAVITGTSQQIKQRYSISTARVKSDIKITARATKTRPRVEIIFKRKPPGLQHYKPVEITRAGIKRTMGKRGVVARKMKRSKPTKGVSVEVKRGERKTVKGAFLAMMPRGGEGIWRRKKGEKRRLERLYGPSIGGMFTAIGGKDIAQKIINERIEKVFMRQIERQRFRMGGEKSS